MSASAEESRRRGLRVGVLCDAADHLERWQLQCLQELLQLEGAELCAVVVDPATRRRRGVPHIASPGCLVRRPLSLHQDALVLGWGDPSAEEALHAAAPDLLLCFNFDALDERLVRLPPLGTWCFAHDASVRAGEAPPCQAELARGERVQHASLLRLVGPRSGFVLREGVLRSVRSSWALHVDRVYGEAASWPAQLCRSWLAGLPLPEAREERLLTPAERPSELALHAFASKLLARRVHRSFARRLRREEWGVGLVREPLMARLSSTTPLEIDWLEVAPPAAFRADPFGVWNGAEGFVLFEEWDEELGRGHIAAAPVDAAGRAGRARRVFDAPHHLSYPCAFEHAGSLYCVPESSQAAELALFRCNGRADHAEDWERVATLLSGESVVDATPCLHEGRWWLWCADASGDAATRLRLFMADRLEGPWREHPRSPVKSDVRSARPAGTPFVHEGALYRPAQDCSAGYGGAVVVLRVDTLSDKEYAEEPVARLTPDPEGPYPNGLHTLTRLGDWSLVDGKRWAPTGVARWLRRRR